VYQIWPVGGSNVSFAVVTYLRRDAGVPAAQLATDTPTLLVRVERPNGEVVKVFVRDASFPAGIADDVRRAIQPVPPS
jgi:hypothetical protein